jgi:type IV pilus assembly protein PilV
MMSLQQRSQRGFTLIEILVTVVLISVGLLGVAALQLTTLRGNQEAYVRSQASALANDILDRMRANSTNFRSDANPYQVALNGTGDASTRAGADLMEWQLAINRMLPGGATDAAGRIDRSFDAAARRYIVTVTIQWRERAEGSGAPIDNEQGQRTFRTRSEI